MGEPKATHKPIIELSIDGGADIGFNMQKFEWASFVNGGYIVRGKVYDPYFNILKNLATKGYLKDGRVKETPVKFKLKWSNGDETTERTAFMTTLAASGKNESGTIEFIGIDPPSYYLNEGTADGKVYKGNVSGVIKQVVNEFAPNINVEVTETDDNKENLWYMMRQDPKTFIRSMLDWSAGVTPKKTHWVVASVDKKLIIKEQAALESKDYGVYHVNRNGTTGKDVLSYEVLADNSISPLQTKLITSGISAISGEFLDKISDSGEQKVFVKDENTQNKVNVDITQTQGFKKPDKKWATAVMAIPEHSAGELGIQYNKYIDGRARGLFLNMLNLVMRMRLKVTGEYMFDDSSKLGVAKCTVSWKDIDGEPYFLSGKWLIYGFHHVMTVNVWSTDLYLARLDFDASAKKV
jgi:hypothetical protein